MGGLREKLAGAGVVGLDTSVFIYQLEANPTYAPLTKTVFENLEAGKFQGVTSTITLMELTVLPWRMGHENMAREYEALLVNFPNLSIVDIDRDVSRLAANFAPISTSRRRMRCKWQRAFRLGQRHSSPMIRDYHPCKRLSKYCCWIICCGGINQGRKHNKQSRTSPSRDRFLFRTISLTSQASTRSPGSRAPSCGGSHRTRASSRPSCYTGVSAPVLPRPLHRPGRFPFPLPRSSAGGRDEKTRQNRRVSFFTNQVCASKLCQFSPLAICQLHGQLRSFVIVARLSVITTESVNKPESLPAFDSNSTSTRLGWLARKVLLVIITTITCCNSVPKSSA